jgi:hypothetical protein
LLYEKIPNPLWVVGNRYAPVYQLYAQQSTTVTGSVKNSKTKRPFQLFLFQSKGEPQVHLPMTRVISGLLNGSKTPFTISDFFCWLYANKEVAVTTNNQSVNVEIDVSFTLGDEVVVAASRVPERILGITRFY